jgi:hypothetical protein
MIIGSINNETKKLIKKNNLTTIVFACYFNDYIEEDFISEHVEKIIFGYKSNITNFNYQIDQMIYEEDLFIDDNSFSKFNSKSINNFYQKTNIKWIIFPNDSTFNQDILTLPINLEFLSLGCNYTKSLLNLPIGLKYFILSTQLYNPDISKIPSGIEYFGLKTSNDMIINKIPKMTKYLNLDTCRYTTSLIGNNQVFDSLPDGLEVLRLKCSYKSELINIPNCLKKIYISNLYSLDTLKNLPPTLELLNITFSSKIYNNLNNSEYFSNLPNCLRNLTVDINFSSDSIIKPKLNLDNLPESLSKLSINTYLFNGIFDNLPNLLDEFDIKIYESEEVNYYKLFNNLPRNLKKFKISRIRKKFSNDQKIDLYISNIPKNLEKIILSNCINFNSDKNYICKYYDDNFNQIEFNDNDFNQIEFNDNDFNQIEFNDNDLKTNII